MVSFGCGRCDTLHKSDAENDSLAFIHTREIPVYNEVIKKDSVVTYDNVRYRGYVYINPSKIKVMRPGVSEEGLGVDNVHISAITDIIVCHHRIFLNNFVIKQGFPEYG
mgnify:CR=1 FL=1